MEHKRSCTNSFPNVQFPTAPPHVAAVLPGVAANGVKAGDATAAAVGVGVAQPVAGVAPGTPGLLNIVPRK